jgi:hypothetical protein
VSHVTLGRIAEGRTRRVTPAVAHRIMSALEELGARYTVLVRRIDEQAALSALRAPPAARRQR